MLIDHAGKVQVSDFGIMRQMDGEADVDGDGDGEGDAIPRAQTFVGTVS